MSEISVARLHCVNIKRTTRVWHETSRETRIKRECVFTLLVYMHERRACTRRHHGFALAP